MPELFIEPVTTRGQQQEFIDLPRWLYANDRNWIPPLLDNHERLLGFKPHPFYRSGEIQTFLARRGGEVCGRIAAIVNEAHNARFQEQRGFFGFYESTNDPQVAAALLNAARGWLRSRGMAALRGPMNPSMNYEMGLLIEGFDTPPTFMMTYNKPYYAALFERGGLRKEQDAYAFWGRLDMLEGLDSKLGFMAEECIKRFNVKLRRLDTKNFHEDVRMFLHIYNQSLGNTWGFVPLSEAEVEHSARDLRHLLVPEMTRIAEVEGRPVACVFGMLDYNLRIKQIDGRLFPLGFMRLLWNRRGIRRVRLISTNVLPEFQSWGLGLVLMHGLVRDLLDWGMQEVEFSWVLESNHLSRRTLERGGAKLTKTYRVYEGDL